MACERIKSQISGTELTLDSKKQHEYTKQQEELDKQKAVLLRRQGELEIRPDAEVPDVQAQIANEAPIKKEEASELQREQPEAGAERQNAQPRAEEVLPKQEAQGVEEIRNAENIPNLENAVIVNNEVVGAEKAGEKNEDKAPENNNEEVKEEIKGPQEPENAPQEQELDEDDIYIDYDEQQNDNKELDENDIKIIDHVSENKLVNEKELIDFESADPKEIESRIGGIGSNDPQNDKKGIDISDFEIIDHVPENKLVNEKELIDFESVDPKEIESRIGGIGSNEPQNDNKELDENDIEIDYDESQNDNKELDENDIEIDYDEPQNNNKELDENDIEIDYDEPQNDNKELDENDIKIVDHVPENEAVNEKEIGGIGKNEPEKVPVQDEKKAANFVIENAEPEKQPMKQVVAQPVPEQEIKAEQKQPKADEVKAEPAKKADVHNDLKPKTAEQQQYEKFLESEKKSIMNKLASFETDRENGVKTDMEAYKKTVAEAMAVEKLESMYKENGRMFEKTFETQKKLYADFSSKNAHFDRFTSMRDPGQILERMMNNKSLSAEMEQRKYDPSLTLNGFIKQYKEKEFQNMSRTEFDEIVQDSKTVMHEDIRRSAGKVSEEEMNVKLARFATFIAISPIDQKTGSIRENATINKLRKKNLDLDDVLGEEGLSDGRDDLRFKSILKKYGTEKLTEMALDGDGQKLSAELIQAGVKQKNNEKTYAKQKEAVHEMTLQPKPEMTKLK